MPQLIHVRNEPGIAYWKFEDTDADLCKAPPKESRRRIESIIFSDTHFGTSGCRARALLATLNTFWIEEHLILLGDIFHDLNFSRISSDQWKVISRIRKLTNPELALDEVWVRGNHDEASLEVLSHFIGLKVRNEFKWKSNGKQYLAIHGDQFDTIVSNFPAVASLATRLYSFVQWLDPLHRHVGRWMTRKYNRWLKKTEQVTRIALQYGHEHRADYVICGHTHVAMQQTNGDVTYLNSGCWVKNPSSFITVTDGKPTLNIVELF